MREQNPALDANRPGATVLKLRLLGSVSKLTAGRLRVVLTPNPLRVEITRGNGSPVQTLQFEATTGPILFCLGRGPIFGRGEGGPQFDRRGENDPMVSFEDAIVSRISAGACQFRG